MEGKLKKNNIDFKEYWDEMYQSEFDLLYRFKMQYKEEIMDELEYINSINSNDKIFTKWKEKFVEIIYEFYNCIDFQTNTIAIMLYYNMYRKKYYKILSRYVNDYCNTSNLIEINNNNLKIDKTTSIKSVRKDITITINKILKEELDKFKVFDCYYNIEQLLLEVKNSYTTLCMWGYLDIQTIKRDFKNDIMDEIVKYNERKQKVDDLIVFKGYLTLLEVELYKSLPHEEKFKKIYNKYVSKSTRVKIKLKK